MRLLIADSDPTLKELYEHYFTNQGCQVVTVGNGLQCIHAIREQMPDVLVIEQQIPWGGGDGVLQCLHQDYPFDAPEVVVLTSDGHTRNSCLDGLPSIGAYLRKPFLMRDLSKLIQSFKKRVTDAIA